MAMSHIKFEAVKNELFVYLLYIYMYIIMYIICYTITIFVNLLCRIVNSRIKIMF